MKKVICMLLTGCVLFAAAQKWENIKGSGNIIKESRTVETFTAIDSRGAMDVEISYGNSNNIEVEADDNILPHIITKTEGSTLVITSDKNGFSTSFRIHVNVTMSKISAVKLSGSGGITGKGAFGNDGTAQIDTRGSGSIKLEFANFSNINASTHGSGDVYLKGNTETLNAETHGSGNINATDVACKNAKAKTNGSGDVKVNVSESLEAVTNGSGNVFYQGNAASINAKSNGSGKIIKR